MNVIGLARYTITDVVAAQRALDTYGPQSEFWSSRRGQECLAVIAAMDLQPTPEAADDELDYG